MNGRQAINFSSYVEEFNGGKQKMHAISMGMKVKYMVDKQPQVCKMGNLEIL